MLHLVVALKNLRQAKSRLAAVLNQAQREMLVVAMARDLIDLCIAHPEVAEVTLVTGAHWDRYLRDESGLNIRRETTETTQGLNAALDTALDGVSDQAVLIVHGDLPLLSGPDIDELATQLADADLIICPDDNERGTNGLAFRPGHRPPLMFGSDSYAGHRRSAAQRGCHWRFFKTPGFSFDVDTPADLQRLAGLPSAGASIGKHLQAWLETESVNLSVTQVAASSGPFDGVSVSAEALGQVSRR